MRLYLQKRQDVVDCMIELQNYENQFLPNALRKFFSKLEAPNDRGRYLQELLNAFSKRFCQCNPNLGYSVGKETKSSFHVAFPSFQCSAQFVERKCQIIDFEHFFQTFQDCLLFRLCVRDVLFAHFAVSGPHVAARQEQNVQERIHTEHAERPTHATSSGRRSLRRDVRQRVP